MKRVLLNRGFAALAGAAAAVAVAAAFGLFASAKAAPAGPSDDAVRHQFETAWTRWSRGEFEVTEHTTRSATAKGATKQSSTARIIQRGEDRVVIADGSLNGVVGGRAVQCDQTEPTYSNCTWGDGVESTADLRQTLERVRQQTTGPTPLYRLTLVGTRCFQFRKIRDALAVDWGDRTRLCFDRGGVLVTEEREQGELVDRTERKVTSRSVSDDAFPQPPALG